MFGQLNNRKIPLPNRPQNLIEPNADARRVEIADIASISTAAICRRSFDLAVISAGSVAG